MKFGQKIRSLRRDRQMGQRALAEAVGVSFTYISKIENHRLDFGDYPSDELIVKLAKALDADPDELLVLAQKVPEPIRQRVLERPEAFRKLAALDDRTLDLVLAEADNLGRDRAKRRNPKLR
jgi:transcriptional regulator with XRE-family HTH domain